MSKLTEELCFWKTTLNLGACLPLPRDYIHVHDYFFSNNSETAWRIKAKFHVEPPGEEGTKVYINDEGHTTKMAAMLYMVKTFKKFFSGTTSPMILTLSMYHRGLKLYKVYINNDPGMTLTYFL